MKEHFKHCKARFVVQHFQDKKIWLGKKLTKNLFSHIFVLLFCLAREIQDFGRIYIFSAILFYFCEQHKPSNKCIDKSFWWVFSMTRIFYLKNGPLQKKLWYFLCFTPEVVTFVKLVRFFFKIWRAESFDLKTRFVNKSVPGL